MTEPVIYCDAGCNLCSGMVKLITISGGRKKFRYQPLQSSPEFQVTADTILVQENGKTYTKSTAALHIAKRLQLPWSLLYFLVLVPRPLRDACYDFIARHRYRWFGRCTIRPFRSNAVR